MSFGFAIGDFLAVIELAIKIKKDFQGAPSAYKAAVDMYVCRATCVIQLTTSA